jgi:hypothetical protein
MTWGEASLAIVLGSVLALALQALIHGGVLSALRAHAREERERGR